MSVTRGKQPPRNAKGVPAGSTPPLIRRIAQLRWPIVIIVVGAAAVHQALLFALLHISPPPQESLAQLAVYSLTGIVVVWVGLRLLARAASRQEQTEAELRNAYGELERTHRQLQIIHEVGRRVANASDMQELLQIAARIPVDLLGAASTTVITFHGNETGNDAASMPGVKGDLEFTWGLNDDAVQVLRREVEKGFSAERCRECQPLTAHVDHDCPLLTSLQDTPAGEGLGQIVCLPLGRGQERSGVVTAYLPAQATLSDEETRLVSIVATEITAAMESVRLRERQMATLYAVDRATQERRGLDSLLARALQTTVTGWGASSGAILLAEDGDWPPYPAAPGRVPWSDHQGERAGDWAWVVRAQQGLGDDLTSATMGLALRLAEQARQKAEPVLLQERVTQEHLSSLALILLQTEGETLGALFLGSETPGYFKPAQLDLMKAVGSQIALAVRNAQLYSQLRQSAVLEERYRLSREMHDGVAQTLGFLGMHAERLEHMIGRQDADVLQEELKELRGVIAEAYLDVREAIDGLRLTVDRPGGFASALQAHVEDFTRRTGLPVDYSGLEDLDLPADLALHLLRITQEALANVRRHADADHVSVSLGRDNGHLELTVADDGRGFDFNNPQDRHHVGLASMRERVRSLDGQLILATSPGHGTRVTARVPLR